jgi:hypothetical protein
MRMPNLSIISEMNIKTTTEQKADKQTFKSLTILGVSMDKSSWAASPEGDTPICSNSTPTLEPTEMFPSGLGIYKTYPEPPAQLGS